MSVKWTPEQLDAIDSRKGTVLVSAAAGSGKTAVLVERVIRRLTDSEHPCSTENLLIVTFTKAATAQMRERIGAAILKKLAEDPSDSHLRRQYMMLPFAQICTIDSFCNDLVRENFHALGIAPDYSVLDNETVLIMKRDAAEHVLERAYGSGDEAFLGLSDLISSGSSDESLSMLIRKLYDISTAYPFPDEWLAGLTAEYDVTDINESVFGKTVLSYLSDMLCYCISESEKLLERMSDDAEIEKAYAPGISADIVMYGDILEKLGSGWDEAREAFGSAAFVKLGSVPRGYDSETKKLVRATRDRLKRLVKKALDIMCVTAAEHAQDMRALREPAGVLTGLVRDFAEEYSQMKRQINSADFSDILHLALSLLVKRENGVIKKTELAHELSSRYAEILVDEYQDINEAQDMIFRAVSADEKNLFMVGDVKQSIYRFRQAMPEIFLRRREAMTDYDGAGYPARILLSKNFRSRRGVTSAVNYIFRRIMSPSAGELEYDDGEALSAAAKYPARDIPDAELHIVDVSGCDGTALTAQAEYAARYIKNAVESGMQITKDGELKPAGYGDFCILLRSAKNTASVFAQALSDEGIPVFSPETGGFFEAAEISFALSLLRVLDNPVQDIPLAAVMLSPVFGFTADELAALRAGRMEETRESGHEPLYRSVCAAAAQGDKKAADFVERLNSLRRLSLTLSAGELVRRVIDETGYTAIAGAMPDGERRKLNLSLLADYANRYEAAGNMGLSGFIRFIDKIAHTQGDLATAARPSEDANVVRIMTVHQSKGLEFPVCILADMQHKFNERDNNSPVIVSPSVGIGIKRRAEDGVSLYDTAGRQAVKLMSERMGRSEEMRVLYVALTRAKENLVMLTALENPENKLASLAAGAGFSERVSPFSVLNMNSFSDWVISALMCHPDAQTLRDAAGVGTGIYFSKKDDFRLKTVISAPPEPHGEEEEKRAGKCADKKLVGEIAERLDYEDSRAPLACVPAKRAASDSSRSGINREYFASARPAFMGAGGLTPAQRGTATHKFMQFSDYSAASRDVRAERDRLVSMGFLSELEGEAVNVRAVERFFASELAQRIFRSETVMREKKFTVFVPVSEFFPELPQELADEKTVVQGIADCAFVEDGELVIVDYKTDSDVTAQELAQRYSAQLRIYRRALSECLKMRVKQTLLYSFSLSETIEVSE